MNGFTPDSFTSGPVTISSGRIIRKEVEKLTSKHGFPVDGRTLAIIVPDDTPGVELYAVILPKGPTQLRFYTLGEVFGDDAALYPAKAHRLQVDQRIHFLQPERDKKIWAIVSGDI